MTSLLLLIGVWIACVLIAMGCATYQIRREYRRNIEAYERDLYGRKE